MDDRYSLVLFDHLVQIVIISPDVRDTEDPAGPTVDDSRHRVGLINRSHV